MYIFYHFKTGSANCTRCNNHRRNLVTVPDSINIKLEDLNFPTDIRLARLNFNRLFSIHNFNCASNLRN